MRQGIGILGIYFDTVSLAQAKETVIRLAKRQKGALVATPNGTIVANAQKHPELRDTLRDAALVLPDGISVVRAAKALGTPFPFGRVTGIDLAESVCEAAAREGLSLYFFGGEADVARKAAERLTERFRGLSVRGVSSGYGYSLEGVIEAIGNSGADIVVCCLGSPRQELVGRVIAERLSRPVLALGGSLDVFSGKAKRAPYVFRRLSLEWLWRCLSEPKRFLRLMPLVRFYFAVRRAKKGKKACNSWENPL